jgi:CubicO group peptidase (beta-lactamase class C family)
MSIIEAAVRRSGETETSGEHPDLVFAVASLSKQVVAKSLVSLADDKALDLHAPISAVLPEATGRWGEITAHQLLTHTAGVGHWGPRPGYDLRTQRTPQERVELILGSELTSAPGTRWLYSSPGYLLLGHLAERATGQSWADLVRERIIEPMALTRTFAGERPAELEPGWEPGVLPGTNDLWSTAGDFALLVERLYEDDDERLTTPYVMLPEADGWLKLTAYGYGVYFGTAEGRPALLHSGDIPGFRSVSVWLPEDRIAAAVLADDDEADVETALKSLLDAGE